MAASIAEPPARSASTPADEASECDEATIPARNITARLLQRQYDLADVLRALHQPVRVGRLLERESLVDLRLDPAALDQRPDPLAQALRDRALEGRRPRPQRRAGNREALAHHEADVHLGFHAAQE